MVSGIVIAIIIIVTIIIIAGAIFLILFFTRRPPSSTRYRCSNNQCISDSNGIYNSLQACQSACQITTRYSCQNGQCVIDSNGNYNNISDCQSICSFVPISHRIEIRQQGATEWSSPDCFIGLGDNFMYAAVNNDTGVGWLTTSSNDGGIAAARKRPFSQWNISPTISSLNWTGQTQTIGYQNGQLSVNGTIVPTVQYRGFVGPNWEMRVIPGECDHP